ncbi:TRY3, partial [Symbiodinium necroappetens]
MTLDPLPAPLMVPLPLPSLPLAPRSKPKGALSRSSPSISKSVSFSETRLLKQRHIEMLAAVAIQSWSQSLDLRPLKRNDFLDQCLLSGLLEVGRPESGQLGSEGPVFDPVALSQEDEVFEKGLFDMSINIGRLGLLAAAIGAEAELEDDVNEEELLMSLWYLKKRRGYHSFPTRVKDLPWIGWTQVEMLMLFRLMVTWTCTQAEQSVCHCSDRSMMAHEGHIGRQALKRIKYTGHLLVAACISLIKHEAGSERALAASKRCVLATELGVGHADLHYVEYKLLKKKCGSQVHSKQQQRIKDVVGRLQASELAEALTANTVFEEELAAEIGRVNQCFSQNQHDLLDRTAQLAEELQQRKGCSDEGGRIALSRADAMRQLVDILQEVDQLRKYAVWNAVAVVKILKKRRKQTSFGIEDTAAERAGWMSRQCFFSGSDFAELHASVESLGHMLVLSEILPEEAGHEHAAYRSKSNQEPQQCPICLDTISDMVELSCKHRFCWKCFVLGPIAFQPGEYRITQCPICRRETQVEESDEAA